MVRHTTGRKRDGNRSKSAILNGAISEFAQRGLAGTRVEDIAMRAGVAKSLIYQHFGSKNELYAESLIAVLATITEKSAQYSQDFAQAVQAGDVRAYIRRYLDNHLALIEAVPEYPRLMAWENLEGGRTLSRLPLQATYQAFLSRVRKIMAPLVDRGLLHADFNLAHAAQAVMALSHFFVIHQGTLQHLFQMDPLASETRNGWIDYCTDMMMSVFNKEPAAQPE